MTANITPLWRRVSAALAFAIVRAWPRETRDWGHAFAAELSEISTFSSSGSWLLGGFKMLLKERLRHFWKSLAKPFGLASNDSLDSSYKTFSRFPRLPRLIVAVLLIASLAILLHPEVRSGEVSLFRSYSLTSFDPQTWSSAHKLHEALQKNRDPQLLALLSLISTADTERVRLSNEAIEKDASLTWVDYEQSLFTDLQSQHYLPAPRLVRLRQWDPNNAVTQLLVAEAAAQPLDANTFDSMIRNRIDGEPPPHLANNPKWVAAMDRAFTAPQYDNYLPRLLQLVRDVSNRYQIRDSEIVLYVVWHSRMIHFQMAHAYADLLSQRATDAQRRGDPSAAAANYRQILAFANRMSLNQSLPAEKYFSEDLSARAGEKLQPLLLAMGRTEESTFLAFQLAQLRESHDMRLMGTMPVHYSKWKSVLWSGLQINLVALSIAAMFAITTITFLLLWFRRNIQTTARTSFDGLLSLLADASPVLLVVSCALLYFVYHPYAQICSEFFRDVRAPFDIDRFVTAAAVVNALPEKLAFLSNPLVHWTTITISLFLLAAILLFHVFLQRKNQAHLAPTR